MTKVKLSTDFIRQSIEDKTDYDLTKLYGEPAVSYRPKAAKNPDLPLAEFEAGPKAIVIRRQVRTSVDALATFLDENDRQDHEQQKQNLGQLLIRTNQGSTGDFGGRLGDVLGPGKEALDEFMQHLFGGPLPVPAKVAHVRNLAAGLGVCVGGVYDNVAYARDDIALSGGDLRAKAKARVLRTRQQAARDFATSRYGQEPDFHEIHFAQAFLNRTSSQFGTAPVLEGTLPSDDRLEADGAFAAWATFEKQHTSGAVILRQAAEECLGAIRQSHAEFCRNAGIDPEHPLDGTQALALRDHFNNRLIDSLKPDFGDVDIGLLIHELPPRDEEAASYGVIDDETLLMHAFVKSLRKAGVLDDSRGATGEKEAPVVGQREDAFSIREIGDTFYVKERPTASTFTRKPLTVTDLRPEMHGRGLVLAALQNTRDAASLAAFPADRVADAIREKEGSEERVLAFSSPGVRRYREAKADNGNTLLDHLFDIGASPADVTTALLSAAHEQELALSARLVVLLPNTASGQDGNLPLHHAAALGLVPELRTLLDRMQQQGQSRSDLVDTPNAKGQTALSLAARENRLDAIGFLKTEGAASQPPGPLAKTPLMEAAESGHVDAVKVLLSQPDVNLRTLGPANMTALDLACDRGRAGVVEVLLADPRQGEFPVSLDNALKYATRRNHVEIMRKLLDAGAQVHGRRSDSGVPPPPTTNALILAATIGSVDGVKLLLKHGADIDAPAPNGSTALSSAVRQRHFTVVELLIGAKARVNQLPDARLSDEEEALPPLHEAAISGDEKIASRLIDAGAVVTASNGDGFTALDKAAFHGHLPMVRLLLDKGADIHAIRLGGLTALCDAAERGHAGIVEELLARQANVRQTADWGVGPLHFAVKKETGNRAVIELLLKNGADPNEPSDDPDGHTPFEEAVHSGNVEAVQILLEAGGDIGVLSRPRSHSLEPERPLVGALLKGHRRLVSLMLDRGVDPNTTDLSGCPVALRAMDKNDLATFRELLAAGADTEARWGNDRHTLLIRAVTENKPAFVQALLQGGANPNAADAKHQTARAVAKAIGADDVAAMLKDAGGSSNYWFKARGRSRNWGAAR